MQIPSICLRKSQRARRCLPIIVRSKKIDREKRSTRGKHARRQTQGISLINPSRLSTSCRRTGRDPLVRPRLHSFPIEPFVLVRSSCHLGGPRLEDYFLKDFSARPFLSVTSSSPPLFFFSFRYSAYFCFVKFRYVGRTCIYIPDIFFFVLPRNSILCREYE